MWEYKKKLTIDDPISMQDGDMFGRSIWMARPLLWVAATAL